MSRAAEQADASPTPRGEAGGESSRAWLLILAAVCLFIVTRIALHPLVVNQDAALYLHCGRLLLQGLLPYVDFADLNPPMVMYVNLLPALVSRALSIHLIVAFHLLVAGFALFSSMMTRRLLARSELGIGENERNGAALLILLFSLYLLHTPDSDWGQREHLFLLAYVPFFAMRWIRWSGGNVGTGGALVLGVGAAIGTCLKPHFVFVAVLVELAEIARFRRLRPLLAPEAMAFVLTGLAYGLHFLLIPEAMAEAFFGRWLPLIAEGYGAYNRSWREMLLRPELIVACVSALAAVAGVWGLSSPRARASRLWSLFAVAAAAMYASQHKGWAYQLIPALFGGLFALLLTVSARMQRRSREGKPAPVLALRTASYVLIGSLLANGSLLGFEALKGFRAWPDPGIGEILDRHSAKGDPLLVISTDVGTVYPLTLQMSREAGSRYLWTFPLAMIYASGRTGKTGPEYPYPARERMGEAEARLIEELGTDIAISKPPMILVNAQEFPQGLPRGFTIPGYLEAIGFTEREMKGYRYEETAFLYDIYVREAGAESPAAPSAVAEDEAS